MAGADCPCNERCSGRRSVDSPAKVMDWLFPVWVECLSDAWLADMRDDLRSPCCLVSIGLGREARDKTGQVLLLTENYGFHEKIRKAVHARFLTREEGRVMLFCSREQQRAG